MKLSPILQALAIGLLLAPAADGTVAKGASPALAARSLTEAVAAHDGDLSLLIASAEDGSAAQLRRRPDSTGLVQVAWPSPALRIHYAQGSLSGLADADLDGIPDRVRVARDAARSALRVSARLGLGAPADDGDGELDIYLVPLGGLARGYAALEGALPPGRGRYGFVVADPSSHFDEHGFRAIVARSVARLVLAASDAAAPAWWSEASALWLEERSNGTSPDIARALHARWSRPEIGLAAGMPPLLRGNAGLIWALDDPKREAAVLRSAWRALAERSDARSPDEVLLRTFEGAAGMPLEEIQLRAGIRQVVQGQPPGRWAHAIGPRGLADEVTSVVGPRGASLVHLAGGGSGEALRLSLRTDEAGWGAALIARTRGGSWERVALALQRGEDQLLLPWEDYVEAILLLAAPAERSEGGTLRLDASPASRGALFGLASFAARRTPMGGHALQWESSWEDGLFGWIVERSVGAEGAWEMLSALPLPALGDERRGSSYTLYDERALKERPLRYRLVALTKSGLRVSGPTLVVAP